MMVTWFIWWICHLCHSRCRSYASIWQFKLFALMCLLFTLNTLSHSERTARFGWEIALMSPQCYFWCCCCWFLCVMLSANGKTKMCSVHISRSTDFRLFFEPCASRMVWSANVYNDEPNWVYRLQVPIYPNLHTNNESRKRFMWTKPSIKTLPNPNRGKLLCQM